MRPIYPTIQGTAGDDDDEEGLDIAVEVRCPFCPRAFNGKRDSVEEELYGHLWKVHEDKALDYMLSNMYIPEDLRSKIFEEMAPEYVAWIVDTSGEIVKEQ